VLLNPPLCGFSDSDSDKIPSHAESHGMVFAYRYWKSCVLPPLDMTKDELLALLGSLDLIEAGAAVSFVESLDSDDPRFLRLRLGKPMNTLGYWLDQQRKAASGGDFHH